MVDYRKKKTTARRESTGRRARQKTPFRPSARAAVRKNVERAADRPGERLQKWLAGQGAGSRRRVDEMIASGLIQVNRVPAVLGQRVRHGDVVTVRGRRLTVSLSPKTPGVLLYHKPEGEIVSRNDPEGRPSVFDRLPKLRQARWIPVGRLDFNTCGLLMLTTSGQLADRFMHPRYGVEREYAVRIRGLLRDDQIQALSDGIPLDDGMASVASIEGPFGNDDAEDKHHWYHIVLHEGRNREVRRLFQAIDANLTRLMRVRYGTVRLPPDLKRGATKALNEQEVFALIKDNFPEDADFLAQGLPAPAIQTTPVADISDLRPAGTTDERPVPSGDDAGKRLDRAYPGRARFALNRRDRLQRVSGEPSAADHRDHRRAEPQRNDFRDGRPHSNRFEAGGNRSDRPRRSFDDRPGFNDRGGRQPSRGFDDRDRSRPYREDRGRHASPDRRDDRPRRAFSDRFEADGNRTDRPNFADRGRGSQDRSFGPRDRHAEPRRDDRPRRAFSDRFEANGNRADRPRRPFGDRPGFNDRGGRQPGRGFDARDRSGSHREDRGRHGAPDRRDDRPRRAFSDRFEAGGNRADRSRRSFGDRPNFADRGRDSQGRGFGASRPSEDRQRSAGRHDGQSHRAFDDRRQKRHKKCERS